MLTAGVLTAGVLTAGVLDSVMAGLGLGLVADVCKDCELGVNVLTVVVVGRETVLDVA